MLELGSKAPDFQVTTQTGYEGPLSHFWQDGPLILFFYPKDDTSICTKQACTLQTSMADFSQFGATVVGSSTGSVTSHQQFGEKHGLAFPLVADVGGKLARGYKAFRTLFRISKRITYVIDQQGKIIGRIHNELSVPAHMEMVREALEKK